MHCVRFEMRLNQLLDNRAAPDSDLELLEHAGECPECGELLAAHEILLEGIGLFEAPRVGADFAVRVAAQMATSSQPTSRWASAPGLRRNSIWSVAAVAAGLLIAVGIWRTFGAATSVDHHLDGSLIESQASIAQHIAPAGSSDPYSDFYSRTEEWRLALSNQKMEWVDQMADGLKPVADSMSAALHALRRTFPGGDAPVRSSLSEPLPISGVAATA